MRDALAREKAAAVAGGGDDIVLCAGYNVAVRPPYLGKPEDEAEAIPLLSLHVGASSPNLSRQSRNKRGDEAVSGVHSLGQHRPHENACRMLDNPRLICNQCDCRSKAGGLTGIQGRLAR